MPLLRERIRTTIESARTLGNWSAQADALGDYWDKVEAVVEGLRACNGAEAYDDATAYACRCFIETELPQGEAWLHIVDSHSNLARSAPDEVFA